VWADRVVGEKDILSVTDWLSLISLWVSCEICSLFLLTVIICVQCFDAVGWAAGRASGL